VLFLNGIDCIHSHVQQKGMESKQELDIYQ
jgi:hypothetical protein